MSSVPYDRHGPLALNSHECSCCDGVPRVHPQSTDPGPLWMRSWGWFLGYNSMPGALVTDIRAWEHSPTQLHLISEDLKSALRSVSSVGSLHILLRGPYWLWPTPKTRGPEADLSNVPPPHQLQEILLARPQGLLETCPFQPTGLSG